MQIQDQSTSSSKIFENVSMLQLLFTSLLLLSIILVTFDRYTQLSNYNLVDPEVVLANQSGAPFKYRILPSLFYAAARPFFETKESADDCIIFIGISCCFVTAWFLFFVTSQSLEISGLGVLALYGCMFGGAWVKMRTEFFEAACVTLGLLFLFYRKPFRWLPLHILTAFAAFNRETWIFFILALGFEVVRPSSNGPFANSRQGHTTELFINFGIFTLIQLFIRGFYGHSAYVCPFWTWQLNLQNLSIIDQQPAWVMGNGILWLAGLSLFLRRPNHLQFIAIYFAAMFTVAFFIAVLSEFRIFLPVFPLLIAAVIETKSKARVLKLAPTPHTNVKQNNLTREQIHAQIMAEDQAIALSIRTKDYVSTLPVQIRDEGNSR